MNGNNIFPIIHKKNRDITAAMPQYRTCSFALNAIVTPQKLKHLAYCNKGAKTIDHRTLQIKVC
jgi:hypothetical protein